MYMYVCTNYMKSTKVQNPRCNKCSTVHAVADKNCLVAEYRVPYRIGPRTINIVANNYYTHAHL